MIDDIGTVFAAEFLRRIRSRPFLIGLIIGVLALVAMTKLPTLLSGAFSGSERIVVTGDPRLAASAAILLKNEYKAVILLPGATVTPELLKSNDAGAALVIASSGHRLDVALLARDPSTVSEARIKRILAPLQLALATQSSAEKVKKDSDFTISVKPIGSHFSSSDQATEARGIAYTLIFFLYILILINSQLVMSSVAEEKTSRIAELLVASVDPSALLAGKILAGAALAILQLAVWIGTSLFIGGPGAGQSLAAGTQGNPQIFSLAGLFDIITPSVVLLFLTFFVLGFLQLSTLMAAFASLINRTEDLGSITAPLVIPVVTALLIAIAALESPDASWAVGASLVPIISPFVMFARIAVSNVPVWQIALSLISNLSALYLIIIFAGKLYRVGMLLYGRAPKLSQVWHVLRS